MPWRIWLRRIGGSASRPAHNHHTSIHHVPNSAIFAKLLKEFFGSDVVAEVLHEEGAARRAQVSSHVPLLSHKVVPVTGAHRPGHLETTYRLTSGASLPPLRLIAWLGLDMRATMESVCRANDATWRGPCLCCTSNGMKEAAAAAAWTEMPRSDRRGPIPTDAKSSWTWARDVRCGRMYCTVLYSTVCKVLHKPARALIPAWNASKCSRERQCRKPVYCLAHE